MVKLAPLVLSVAPSGALGKAVSKATGAAVCRFCGEAIGKVPEAFGSPAYDCCVLCGLVQTLGRPRVDEEAKLIWLPELSQPALNALTRRMHIGLHGHGERLETGAQPSTATGDLPTLYRAGQALVGRQNEAELRLGTSNPSALADALLRLSPAGFKRRDVLLGGLRLLPMGKVFEGDRDVYPEIVESWKSAEVQRPAAQQGEAH
ncbi:hypothetical protein Acid7E03_39140 [Acidisoma sp. 7E03]